MFLHLSVILFKGVGVYVPACTTGHMTGGGGFCPGGLCPGSLYPGGSLFRGVSVQRGYLSQGFLSRETVSRGRGLCRGGGLCPGGVSVRETPSTVTSGQYTSYWNAFLFFYTTWGTSLHLTNW